MVQDRYTGGNGKHVVSLPPKSTSPVPLDDWYLAPLFWAGASSCTPIPPLATTVRLLASSHSDANSHIFHRRVLRRLRPTRSTWVPSGLH